MRRTLCGIALAMLCLSTTSFAQDRLTPELLWQLRRVSGPAVSPDGSQFVYGVRQYDIAENRGNTDLYIMSVDGGEPQQLTDWPGSEFNYTWRPDGRKIGFLSGQGGSVQLWEMNPDGSDKTQVTDIEGGIGNFSYAPDGRHVAFTREIKIDLTTTEVYPDLPQANARIIDELMFRHWDQWEDGSYSHLFVASYRNGRVSNPVDLMEGQRFDTPMLPFGGGEQIGWSADGSRIAYTTKQMTGVEYALSTNSDIFVYNLSARTTTNVTEGMMGYDIDPRFSPDGRYMAWLSMERDGYEADRNRIFVRDLASGEARELTTDFIYDVDAASWSADSRVLFFTSAINSTSQLFAVRVESAEIEQITQGMHNVGGFDIATRPGSTTILASRVSMMAPADIYRIALDNGEMTQLTFANADLLEGVDFGNVEERWVRSSDGAMVLSWVIYPPDFDPNQQYPALLFAKGGPQGAMSQFWSYRWNFQIMAANDYIIIAPARRGSGGHGQAWEEQISGDYGGLAMEDLLVATDDLAREPYVDENRLGLVGASFGGYTAFYLMGNHQGRFKAFISHDGIFNLESMYGHTEELFFVNFDNEGPYWENADNYRQFSPHLFVSNWDTPILIVQGGRDYRVPESESFQAFTAAQLMGVESRLLYFPDENHWVLSAQNGILWQREFFGWLDRYLK